MGRAVGIDLGTTNSVLAVLEAGKPTVVASAEGMRVTPSVVGFTPTGEQLVGEMAKRQAISNPERTFRSFKRRMGSDSRYVVDGRGFTPQELSARVLMKLKADAEAFLGEPVDRAVISVPAYFDDAQRQATLEAGRIAGLEVLRLVTEPTAAALAYGLDRFGVGSVMVFDLGGGTLDVSVLELTPGRIEVRAVSGDVKLGGDDFDAALVEWLLRTVEATHRVDVSSDLMALQRLRDAAEQAKIELSAVASTKVTLPFLAVSGEGPVHFDVTVSRDRFDTLTSPLVARIAGPVRRVLEDLSVSGRALDHVVLVGGGSRVPAVRSALSKLLGGRRLNALVNPEEAVALGAALQAGLLTGEVKDVLLLEVTPLALGVETKGGLTFPLISRNTTIPVSRTDLFTTDVDGQTEVTVRVLQGERPLAADNRTLGEFRLAGIPPAPRGDAQIAVTFDIDADGILQVSAQDLSGGGQRQLLITGGSALPDDEVDRMVSEAQLYAAADDRARSEVMVRNQADTLLYDLARVLSLYTEVLPESVVAEAGRAEQSMRIALTTNDVVLIDRRRGELQTCYQMVLQQARALVPQLASDDVVSDVEVLPTLL